MCKRQYGQDLERDMVSGAMPGFWWRHKGIVASVLWRGSMKREQGGWVLRSGCVGFENPGRCTTGGLLGSWMEMPKFWDETRDRDGAVHLGMLALW